MRRREFLLGSTSPLILEAFRDVVLASGEQSRAVQIGLAAMTYWSGFCPILNWWKQKGALVVHLFGGTDVSGSAVFERGFVDGSGDLKAPVSDDIEELSSGAFLTASGNPDDPTLAGEEFQVEWEGKAQCRVDWLTTGSRVYDESRRNRLTFRLGGKPNNTRIRFRILDRQDPPRNILVYQTRHKSQVKSGGKFNPDWVRELAKFQVLRFMDLMGTNGSKIEEFEQIATEDFTTYSQGLESGPKGGFPLSLVCDLARATQADIHFNIPHRASDDCVKKVARYFSDHLPPGRCVSFEYSNECWNWGFPQTQYCNEQGRRLWGSGWWAGQFYGYRSAQCMELIGKEFAARSRWRGVLASQAAWTAPAEAAIQGAKLVNRNLREIFDEVAIAGYFGDVLDAKPVSFVEHSNPGIITSLGHGFKSGQRVILSFQQPSDGMPEVDGKIFTVTTIDADHFAIDQDTTSYRTFSATPRNSYAANAACFDLMSRSEEQCMKSPSIFPTVYSFFAQQVAEACLHGTCSSGLFQVQNSVQSLKNKHFPAYKRLADLHGLELRQYEGGYHLVGGGPFTGYPGSNAAGDRLTQFNGAIANSEEIAKVYLNAFLAFISVGGTLPAKYTEAGNVSRFGPWAGVRWWPCAQSPQGDVGNPVWSAITQFSLRG